MRESRVEVQIQSMEHFTKISDYLTMIGRPPSEHPLFYICPIERKMSRDNPVNFPPFTTDFYAISLKKLVRGTMGYGRTKFDFEHGTLVFLGPRQILSATNVEVEDWGYSVVFHEDFIRGHHLTQKIKSYRFFEYSANEALHLSPREEQTLISVFENMEAEYHNNQDEFSREIIISHLETLLKYSNRFYKRQFINREPLNADLATRFSTELNHYFSAGLIEKQGPPTIQWLARKLSLSPRYMSDSLKAATGKSALDHINGFLIDEAKNLLLEPNSTIAQTAYKLGFEYPQYFSRLFKKKVGMTPTGFRNQFFMN